MKIKSLLLLLIGCAGVSFSATAIIDFGTAVGGGNNPYGNQISGDPKSASEIDDLLALGSGSPTGWKLTVTGLRAIGPANTGFADNLWSSSKNRKEFSDFSKSLGLSSDLNGDVWRDNAALANAGSTVFGLSGLNPGKEYVISFGLGRWQGGGTTTITLDKGSLDSASWFNSSGSKGDSFLDSVGFNSTQWVATYKVVADANGEIAFNFSAVPFGSISFMTVSLPEPSGAMLGMVGMVGFLFRRKR